jgi:hypothetical protein
MPNLQAVREGRDELFGRLVLPMPEYPAIRFPLVVWPIFSESVLKSTVIPIVEAKPTAGHLSLFWGRTGANGLRDKNRHNRYCTFFKKSDPAQKKMAAQLRNNCAAKVWHDF